MKCSENKKKLCRIFSRSLTSYDVYCDIGHAAHAGVTRVLARVRDTCHRHHERGDCLVPLLCDQTDSTTTRVVRERLKQKTFIKVKTDFQVGFSISHFHKYTTLKAWRNEMPKWRKKRSALAFEVSESKLFPFLQRNYWSRDNLTFPAAEAIFRG